MSSGFDLKVTGPGGTLNLTKQPPNLTLGQLADHIEGRFSIPRAEMSISCGFPPKILKGHAHTSLLSLGVASRERMRVKRTPNDSSFLPISDSSCLPIVSAPTEQVHAPLGHAVVAAAANDASTDTKPSSTTTTASSSAPPPAHRVADAAAAQFAEVTSLPLPVAALWCDIVGGGSAQAAIGAFFANPNALRDLGVQVPPSTTSGASGASGGGAAATTTTTGGGSGSGSGGARSGMATSVPAASGHAYAGQVMVLRNIESDNSCLFNAIGFCLERNRDIAPRYRNFIVEAVRGNRMRWHAAILGKPRDEYCAWIIDHRHWGGEIEMIILSERLKVEIAALNVQTKRQVVYGADKGYNRRVYVVYSGIHYDALAMSPLMANGRPRGDEDTSKDTTVFSPGDRAAEQMAMSVVLTLHKERRFTDMAGYLLQCMVCRVALKGNAEAVAHAQKTGHQKFGQLK